MKHKSFIFFLHLLTDPPSLEFLTNLQPFLEAQEELSPGRSPYLLNQFQKKWFRNYARLNVNSVGWVLLKENNNIH